MATILQQQLAAISANSTHQLDLKAQKAQHAKSLLFDPTDAARQSFEDIYQICIEGFEEICRLDSRFTIFASSLFSESSKDVDRGHLTKKENEEVDEIISRFLGLVQGRLLLKPAQKSLEWLVRRWKAHELNTEALLLTVLPYHTDQRIFPATLAILPTDKELPASFKWLHPYIASLSNPPRHAVFSATVSNNGLLAALNSYVLHSARHGYASGITLGFWAGLVAQAVNRMLESSRSGRDAVRKQKEEEILLRILPTVQEALTISKKQKLDELFVGSCMIITILAAKATLSDAALDAMMEAVAGAWTQQTMSEGLSCLAAVTEEKSQTSIPNSVTKAMLKIELVVEVLSRQAESQRNAKLAGGFALGVLQSSCKKADPVNLSLVQMTLDAGLLQDRQTLPVLENVLIYNNGNLDGGVRAALSAILTRIMATSTGPELVHQAARNAKIDLEAFGLYNLPQVEPAAEPIRVDAVEVDMPAQMSRDPDVARLLDFDKILDDLPALPSAQHSFLSTASVDSEIFRQYCRAFQASLVSGQLETKFLRLDCLRGSKSAIRKDPNFLSFLARTWSSGSTVVSIAARARALQVASEALMDMLSRLHKKQPDSNVTSKSPDLQYLIPYIVTALSHASPKVRRAAAGLCNTVQKVHESMNDEVRTWAKDVVYGSVTPREQNLPAAGARQFFNIVVVSNTEECLLDDSYIVRSIAEKLDSSSSRLNGKKLRAYVCEFLALHAAASPVLNVKITLLRILNEIGKSASAARVAILVPCVKRWFAQPREDVEELCNIEDVSVQNMDTAMIGAISHRSETEMDLLRELCSRPIREGVAEAAFGRLRNIWTSIRHNQVKVGIAEWLLELALSQIASSQGIEDHALETLRALELNAGVLMAMLETLPTVGDIGEQPSSPKRQRRTLEAERPRAADHEKIQFGIRHITLVLELVEAAKPSSPELLTPLFHLLAELRQFKIQTGSELVYLHGMVLDTLFSIVSTISKASSRDDQVDKSGIRIDLLVECVRSTSSTQIHNTALLLVSELANWAPDSVLHSVMPLFTFMSSTVLRQSDEYSTHVTNQALTQIVPALAASLKKKGRNLVNDVSELLLSFVAAWEHVPLHRRMGLFQLLVNAVGPDECLGAIAAMLVERYSNTHGGLVQFVSDLVSRYTAATALKSAWQWLNLIQESQQPRPKRRDTTSSLSDALLGLADKDDLERENSIEALVSGLALFFSNRTLREQLRLALAELDEQDAVIIRSIYASLLEHVMRMTQSSPSKRSSSVSTDAILSPTLGLLPTHDFIYSSADLMQSGSDTVRQQVFRSLEDRVYQSSSGNAVDRRTFIDVLPSCSVFIDEEQPVEVRIAAIGCIDAICEKFGKTDKAAAKAAATSVSSSAALGSQENKLRVLSLLCLASIVAVLGNGDESVAVLPKVITAALDYLTLSPTQVGGEKKGRSNADFAALQDAGFRLLTSVLDHVPWILASVPDELFRALIIAAESEDACLAATEFRALATRNVAPADLLQSLERVWKTELTLDHLEAIRIDDKIVRSVRNYVGILQAAVKNYSKPTATKYAPTIFNLLLQGFDLRHLLLGTAVDDLYENVDQTALEVTLKLNDATFRPFFARLVEWAEGYSQKGDEIGRTRRLISLFSFSQLFFEKLQTLVTSYMGYLLEVSAEVLRDSTDAGAGAELLQLVIPTLGACFRNDQDDFWTAPAHFEVIAQPLVNQLRSTRQSNESDVLIPNITDLAANVNASPEQLKSLNNALLSLLRDDSADVRVSAVKCQRAITKRVNFDWLALLPELLPIISELQEDDDAEVERQALIWVKEIEEISGESLEGMLA